MSVEHIQNSVKDVIAYLKENPKDALSNDPPVTAVMENGLRCRATGVDGESIVTDMPEAIGGGGSAPSPGWLSRAALATCDATRIALHAAQLGVTLDTLEVTADSVSDDRPSELANPRYYWCCRSGRKSPARNCRFRGGPFPGS